MKSFRNHNPKDLAEVARIFDEARQNGSEVALAGGGSDLLGMIKENRISPDVLLNLKRLPGLDQIESRADALAIGGLVTLDQLSRHPSIRQNYPVVAEAASSVATPQIRNVATLAGNLCQRPWCWYFREGFPCFKNGGDACYSVIGDNRFNAIFGGGPSFIVHPSDTAPALIASRAIFRIAGPEGERQVRAEDFFILPSANINRENILRRGEVLVEVLLPVPSQARRSRYAKVTDRQTWTHAVVSAAVALDLQESVCRQAKVVLGGVAPIPWRVPAVEQILLGQRLNNELAERAGRLAIEGATPLSRNGYKLTMTSTVVRRTLLSLMED